MNINTEKSHFKKDTCLTEMGLNSLGRSSRQYHIRTSIPLQVEELEES